MTLGGNVCIRNGTLLDYPWKEAVRSLLPICDKVIVCDCDSTDGTREQIDEWCNHEPKLIPLNFPWTDPKGDVNWWPTWLNYAREHLPTEMHIQLDADEVIHEDDYSTIKTEAKAGHTCFFKRLNFWRDPDHLIPEGVCCGTKVLRMAPTDMPIPSDYPYEPAARTMATAHEINARVFHYGFLREKKAFFRKAREVQRIWVNSFDPRLEAAEKHEGHWSEMPGVTGWENNLVNYDGSHPSAIRMWLEEHGFKNF